MFTVIKHKLMYPLHGKFQRLLDNDISPWYIFHKNRDSLIDIKYQVVKRNNSCIVVNPDTCICFNRREFDSSESSKKGELILWQNDTLTVYDPRKSLADMGIIFKKPKQCNLLENSIDGLPLIRIIICNKDDDINIIYSGNSFINYGEKISDLKWERDFHSGLAASDNKEIVGKMQITINKIVNIVANYLNEFIILDLVFLIDGDIPILFSLKSDKKDIDLIKNNDCFKSVISASFENRKVSRLLSVYGFNILKKIFNSYAQRKGYQGFMLKNWYRDIICDWKNLKRYKFADICFAHRKGFMSYRITQYGLDKANYNTFISDRDYRWIRPINNESLKFVYDKVVFRYIMDEYHEYLPKYFFHILNEKEKRIVRLPDLDVKYTEDLSGVLSLIKDFGKVIFKPTEGSHGKGIHILEYRDGYILDSQNVNESIMIQLLTEQEKDYYISEYVDMHSFFREIYNQTACSVRLMVINETGEIPRIENAYLRMAASNESKTDNISNGGICVAINVENGDLYRPEIINDHVIKMCEYHPVTSKAISGKMPNWEKVKDGIIKVSKFLFQLEYMGIDIIITDNEFKIIEINTHQDLHRYPYYSGEIKKYLARKVETKKYENIH